MWLDCFGGFASNQPELHQFAGFTWNTNKKETGSTPRKALLCLFTPTLTYECSANWKRGLLLARESKTAECFLSDGFGAALNLTVPPSSPVADRLWAAAHRISSASLLRLSLLPLPHRAVPLASPSHLTWSPPPLCSVGVLAGRWGMLT